MVQVEGVARAIDPTHDIWTAAEPIVGDWVKTEFGPAGAAKFVAASVKDVADRLKRLPDMMDRLEETLDMPAPTPVRERFAPWWGWFGFIVIMALLGIAILDNFSG